MPLRPDRAGWRKCLGGCDKKMWSRNAGHRICPKCDRNHKGQSKPRTGSSTVYDGGRPYHFTGDDP